jgi:cyclomaltodextrinase
MTIQPGRYRHFKGNEYEVVGIARDSETMEEVVVYRALYGERGLWVRSARMFGEIIERDGRMVPRFQYIGDLEKG